MSCTNCSKVEDLVPETPGLEYSLLDASPVQGRDGKLYKLNSSLIPVPYTPAGGWTVVFNIHGQRVTVTGASAREVFHSTRKIFDTNNLTASDKEIWFNLNIQWTKKTIVKRLVVRLEDLLSKAGVNEDEEQGLHEIKRWSASDWSFRVWNLAELYLTQTEYSYSRFLILVESIRDLFDKSLNPLMGNTACYMEAAKQTARLVSVPIYTQAEARLFFWEFKTAINNTIGIETPNFEQTSQDNHWL